MTRHLNWEGCYNARDLGGLPTIHGDETKWRGLIRSDNLDRLTKRGWDDLYMHGVRTIVDLRHDYERASNDRWRPSDIEVHHLPLEDKNDKAWWDGWIKYSNTPLYYEAFLQRAPSRVCNVVSAIANAQPGGVLFHCVIGRDRTGLITILMLALAGVQLDHIVSDYELSAQRLSPLNLPDAKSSKTLLARENTTSGKVIIDLLSKVDVADYLTTCGLSESEVTQLRSKLTAK